MNWSLFKSGLRRLFGLASESPTPPATIDFLVRDIVGAFQELEDRPTRSNNAVFDRLHLTQGAIRKAQNWTMNYSDLNISSSLYIDFDRGLSAFEKAIISQLKLDIPDRTETVSIRLDTLEKFFAQLGILSVTAETIRQKGQPIFNSDIYVWELPDANETYESMAGKMIRLEDKLTTILKRQGIQPIGPSLPRPEDNTNSPDLKYRPPGSDYDPK